MSAYTNFPFGQRAVVLGSPRRLGHGRTPLRILDEIIISSPFELPTKNQPIFCHQLYERQSRLHIERRGLRENAKCFSVLIWEDFILFLGLPKYGRRLNKTNKQTTLAKATKRCA
ncbi:hypothetical protein VFPPC_17886 [Pochonia chlamydosporia 170]|uniref:Uncharacterized protein n=1 Tax=Pochonia chlamydosporia 170 TaxID=1380566 RepID=A0A219AQC6_METCM|nr:hypothetical protein VFPPC_17886 [Pochonia chlamydosporia 170]OWT42921.1 hypothetical protein VFPPC_17886 [Pochonia chlamydosporia 170]